MRRTMTMMLMLPVLALGQFSAVAPTDAWEERLEALRPSEPGAYFNLAEEVADAAETEADLDLARHLFRLAGVIDKVQYGRSACLALADFAPTTTEQRRLLALARLLDQRSGVPNWIPDPSGPQRIDAGAATTISRAFSYYRAGEGRRALRELEDPDARALFEQIADHIGGVRRFETNAEVGRYNRGEASPVTDRGDLKRMLEVELAILEGDNRSWASDLTLKRGEILLEVDPENLAQALGVNPRLVYFREGRWVASP